ncbi:MAG TPA: AsmA family protein [Candidatus Acidoferrum sp.]|nr:AsmA family protein [Candidatus Acidoferrum sp.]
MGSKLRIVLIVVGVLVVLILIAPFLIPVNQFRPTIEEKASAALGRKVQLGDLSLSLLSGSLSAENLSIGDDPKFSSAPFLTAKSLKVGVELMPLIFSKTLNITGVTIDTPQVTLLHNPSGVWNFSSLGGPAAKAQAKQPPAQKTAAPELSIAKLELKNGKITVGATNSQKRSTYNNLNITASDVSMVSKFPVTVTADLPDGGKFKLDGTAGPVDQEDTSLTPLDAKLAISSLNLASTGFLDSSAGLGGIVDLDGTLTSQGGEAETKGNVKLSKALLVAGGSPAGIPVTVNFGTKYNLRKNTGVLSPSVLKVGSAAAHLGGTYEAAGDTTAVKIKMDAKDMPAKDLEAFLPALGIHLPTGASLAAGTLNSDLDITGPTNKLVISGNIGLFNGRLAGFDLGSKMSAVTALTGIKTGSDLLIEKLTSDVRMAPEGLQAENFNAVIPALGTLVGQGTVDSKNALDFKMAATLANTATYSSSGGAPVSGIGGILGAIGGGKGNCKGATIPFLVKGTTAEPKFVPDVGGIAASLVKSQLGCVGDSTTAGSKTQANPAANPANAVDAISGLFKKKKP